MKKMTSRLGLFILLLSLIPAQAWAATELVPVGQVIGLELRQEQVSVAALDPQLGESAREAGLQAGDVLLSVNGEKVSDAQDVHKALERCDGAAELQILRSGEEKTLRLQPRITQDGPRLGVYLRQGITGIGTVTWYDPNTGKFGALGHGVNHSDGSLARMEGGSAYQARVISVRKGKTGKPGQLFGTLTDPQPLGPLEKNCDQGVFGTVSQSWEGQALPVAAADQVRTGDARILSTVDENGPREYSVKILKIYPGGAGDGRNLLLKVTDPDLLDATGGIVQGMSGSPIIQDGKLVGAVTHVLVNDPSTGYGIFIENMLEAAG